MKKLRGGACFALALILTLALSWGFIELCALIPNEAIHGNMLKSSLTYKNKDAFDIPESGRLWSVADNFADSITLNIAWNMGIYGGLDTKYYNGDIGTNASLYLALSDDPPAPDTDYTRYWHGMAAFARITHLFTDITGTKNICMAAIFLLVLANIILLIRKKCPTCAVCLFLSLLCVGIWNVGLSYEYQPVFIIALVMCLLFILFEGRGDTALLTLSVVGGALTSVFDFLTCETLPCLLPLVIILGLRCEQGREESAKKSLSLCAACILAFGAAYALSFVSKWLLTSIFTGENKFIAAMSGAAVRVGTAESAGFLSGIPANLSVLFGSTHRIDVFRTIFFTGISAAVGASGIYLLRGKSFDKETTLSLLFLASVVFLRYALLSNHSYLHEFFTYRALASTICAFLLCIFLSGRKIHRI